MSESRPAFGAAHPSAPGRIADALIAEPDASAEMAAVFPDEPGHEALLSWCRTHFAYEDDAEIYAYIGACSFALAVAQDPVGMLALCCALRTETLADPLETPDAGRVLRLATAWAAELRAEYTRRGQQAEGVRT